MSAIHLLDTLKQINGLTSDYALARYLGVKSPYIGKLRGAARNGGTYGGSKYRVNGDFILAIYDRDGMPIETIRQLAAA